MQGIFDILTASHSSLVIVYVVNGVWVCVCAYAHVYGFINQNISTLYKNRNLKII